MKRYRFLALALACAGAVTPRPSARADGMMVPSESEWRARRERALINEPEQKAVVLWRAGKEDLIISPSYAGPSDRFAWLVPVPTRPKVEIVKGALFHELAAAAMPRPRFRDGALGGAPGAAKSAAVTVLERKAVGAYDVTVLAATDARALMRWLAANRYHLPASATGPVAHYVRRKWTFVASRVRVPRAAAGLHTGTLAPLRLTFRADRAIYPVRLSAANPEPFSLLVYVLVPGSEAPGPDRLVRLVDGVGRYRAGARPAFAISLPARQTVYPTLARLCSETLGVYMIRENALDPRECRADYVFEITTRRAGR